MSSPPPTVDQRKTEWALFAVAFGAFAYCHQGGGWNQNARFALVRAVVEERTLSIDSFLVYARAGADEGTRLVRVPVRNGEFALEGRRHAFHWRDASGRHVPVAGPAEGELAPARSDVAFVEPGQVACTGDLAFHGGRFHPNKAPGTSFAALPAYSLIHGVERLAGLDPDDWWTLTLNAWLTSALSVGLLSAIGCVLLYRLALRMSGGSVRASLLAALTLAFGTLFFPYATALYEHNVIAVALLAAFHLLYAVRAPAEATPLPEPRARLLLAVAGVLAGYAAITNYVLAIAVVLLGGYLVLAVRRPGGWRWYGLGVLVPFLVLCAYNYACFSTPFSTNYHHQDPAFRAGEGTLLGVFQAPQGGVLAAVLFSPFRGLFYTSPILLLGVFGLVTWLRDPRRRAEARLVLALLVFFLLVNVTFNGWHGGWAAGPRYLAPVLPFLCLPLVAAFLRFFKATLALAALSAAIQLVITAVDPQAPVGIAPATLIEGRPQWRYSPLLDYDLPLFVEGRAGPILRAQRDQVLRLYGEVLSASGEPAPFRARRLALLEQEIDASIRDGAPAPLLPVRAGGEIGLSLSALPTIAGPVSVNPVGVYEGSIHQLFPAGSLPARWNSFNVGEFLFERSRLSLLPLLAWAALAISWRWPRRPRS
jgi:hypothetical protein